MGFYFIPFEFAVVSSSIVDIGLETCCVATVAQTLRESWRSSNFYQAAFAGALEQHGVSAAEDVYESSVSEPLSPIGAGPYIVFLFLTGKLGFIMLQFRYVGHVCVVISRHETWVMPAFIGPACPACTRLTT